MMLRGQDQCVEEHQGQDEPEHELRLADVADGPLVFAIPSKSKKYFTLCVQIGAGAKAN